MARRPGAARSRPARASRSPRVGAAAVGEWVLGRRPAPFVVEKPAPHRPDLLFLLDPDADRVLAEELLAPFHAARRASGASEDEADADVWAAEELLEFKTSLGGALDEWTPDDITKYLLEYYPSHGRKVAEDLQAIPERIDAFLGWLASSGRGPVAALAAVRKRLAEGREAFLREASDPRRFGLAKTALLAMQQAGVDRSDEAAVEAFRLDFDRRLKDDPSLRPDLPGRRRTKAWVWSGEGPPPDPQGPCPSGSGKRCRKCCQPR